jgi:hypothetical protein
LWHNVVQLDLHATEAMANAAAAVASYQQLVSF